MKIRDLLCTLCNQTIGLMEDDSTLFHNSIKYLKKYAHPTEHLIHTTKSKLDFFHSRVQENTHKHCEICGKEETQKYKDASRQRLCVDHDHGTMLIRGLLCARCNTAIGKARDSVEILQSMITYIQKHKTAA